MEYSQIQSHGDGASTSTCQSEAWLLPLILWLKLYNPRTPLGPGLGAIDWVGSLLVVCGTLMVLLGIELGGVSQHWRSATVICLVTFGLLFTGPLRYMRAIRQSTPSYRPLHFVIERALRLTHCHSCMPLPSWAAAIGCLYTTKR